MLSIEVALDYTPKGKHRFRLTVASEHALAVIPSAIPA
jgi:hypothetical protein